MKNIVSFTNSALHSLRFASLNLLCTLSFTESHAIIIDLVDSL